jgi:polyisoprenoid-binding protein YceI
MMRRAIVAATMALAGAATAADRPIDVERSTLTVRVFKTGLFSAFADNHVIRAPMTNGRVSDEGMPSVEITVQTAQMTALDPALSADKRAEVQARMQGPEVLDSARYPEIRFASTRIEPAGVDEWRVTGDLSLHGVTRSVTFPVARRDTHYRGVASIRQRDFGIQPISIAGGTVKVKDELRIEFDIVPGAGIR